MVFREDMLILSYFQLYSTYKGYFFHRDRSIYLMRHRSSTHKSLRNFEIYKRFLEKWYKWIHTENG